MNFRYQPEKNIQLKPNITGWWLTYPSEKYESVGKYIYIYIPNMMGKS